MRSAPTRIVAALAVLIVSFAIAQASRPHGRSSSPDALRSPATHAAIPANSVAALKHTSAIVCSPARRTDALINKTGPFCAPFDSIPAIDHPRFTRAPEVYLRPDEPVIALDLGHVHRAYPVRIVERHEIVNDVVAGRPVVVTFCPLCNSPVAFSRVVAGRTLVFGVSGELIEANLIMFDRQTLSFWQQLTGRAITGRYEGRSLEPVPVQMLPFGDWRSAHPDGEVLIPPKHSIFSYEGDPYGGYDVDPHQESIVVRGEPTDRRLPPKQRVVGVAAGGKALAFALPLHPGPDAVEVAKLGRLRLVAFLHYGVRLPETSHSFAAARLGWSATVWLDRIGSHRLDFTASGGTFVDRHTGSRFDFLGRGLSGPLGGRHLVVVPGTEAFWFAWVFFHPQTKVIRP